MIPVTKIAIVVGSPRREQGLTHFIATELSRAARDAGAVMTAYSTAASLWKLSGWSWY
jgi:hypothetical protein